MDTPKLTKKTKGDDLYPPREIRENTKARRAWIATTLATLAADTTVEARSVGTGSYQHVSVWNIKHTDGRIQLRGICQACGSSVAIEGGWTSLHGYARPGNGYTIGRCQGAQRAPANKELSLTTAIIASLEQGVANLERRKAKLEAAKRALPALDWSDREAAGVLYAKGQRLEKLAYMAGYAARENRQYIAHLRATAIPAFGTAYAEAIVP